MGGIVKVGGTLPDKVVLVNFGALIPNMVVITKGVAAFSLYFNFNPRFRRKLYKPPITLNYVCILVKVDVTKASEVC